MTAVHRLPRGKGLRSKAAKRRKDQTSKALRAVRISRRQPQRGDLT